MKLAAVMALALALGACVSSTLKTTTEVAVETPDQAIPEMLLLDIGVAVFDPGLNEEQVEQERTVSYDIRKAESLYIPYRLMESLEQSANWGAVRMIRAQMSNVDIKVEGKILQSDGELLKLWVQVSDASAKLWFEKTYEAMASKYSYQKTVMRDREPFRSLYNTIANDIYQYHQQLSASELRQLRLISELRFAQSFAPDAFGAYLQTDGKGLYQIKRVPAVNDPLMQRVHIIRERDYLFVDTLQEHYAGFMRRMDQPYDEWRKQSYNEVVALREMRKDANRRLLTGVVSILGGIVAAGSSDGSARAAGQVGVIGGGYMVKSGLDKRQESEIHADALAELSASLEAEVAPQVIDLEDRTVTLTGTVDNQYAQWRGLLKQMYDTELGLEPPP